MEGSAGAWTLLWLSVAFIATRHSRARVHSHHCPAQDRCLFERRKAFLRDSVHHDLVVHRGTDVALGAEVLGAVVCAAQPRATRREPSAVRAAATERVRCTALTIEVVVCEREARVRTSTARTLGWWDGVVPGKRCEEGEMEDKSTHCRR